MSYDKIKFKHGLRSDLPSQGDIGEPLFCIDTAELFIGTGEGRAPVGVVGPKGDKGDPGLNGKNGIDGKDGTRGEQGLKGPRGDVGPQGIQGERGERGPKGDPGRDGRNGLDGAVGPQGPKGDAGPQGSQGLQGERGAKGEDGKSISIKGEKATTSDLPTVGTENEGWLIQGDLHIWDNISRIWVNVGRIQGPQGEKGDTGERGPAGPVNITDSLTMERSDVAASAKAVMGLKIDVNSIITNYINKLGGTMTGNLNFKGMYGPSWDAGRASKSNIYWNATAQNDYGMQFTVDGQQTFALEKNKMPTVFIDGTWYELATKKDIANLVGGDFVGKKIKTGTFASTSLETTLRLTATIPKIGSENIVVLTAVEGFAGSVKILVDGEIFVEGPAKLVFGCDITQNDSGNPLTLPFSSQIQVYTSGVLTNYAANNCTYRWVQYYKA